MSTENAAETDPITIPAGIELWRLMADHDHENFLAWIRRNDIDPHAVTIDRGVVIGDTIDRWEIVGGTSGNTHGHSRRSGYQLQPGEQWTTDDEYAKAIHQVSSSVTTPLPDDIRDKLTTALRHGAAEQETA